jgi:hypothetical protein
MALNNLTIKKENNNVATAIATPTRNGVLSMTTENNSLSEDLNKIVEDILGLRALASTTGFMTFKSQREILARLTPEDLAAVGREIASREKDTKKQPIFNRHS